MTQDAQVRKLFSLLSAGHSLRVSSLKTGMDEKTARKYRKANRMPSELSACHDWRTRPDPFATVWDRVHKQLSENWDRSGKQHQFRSDGGSHLEVGYVRVFSALSFEAAL